MTWPKTLHPRAHLTGWEATNGISENDESLLYPSLRWVVHSLNKPGISFHLLLEGSHFAAASFQRRVVDKHVTAGTHL